MLLPYDINPKCLPSQHAFLTLESKFRGFSGPVGSGKTRAFCDQAILMCMANPGRTGLVGAPTYPMLRDATMRTLLERFDDHGVRYRLNRSEMRISVPRYKATILLRPVENFDRLRGQNLAWFGLDETTYCPEYAWMQLEARLRDPLARKLIGFAVWTPKGFDWVYRRFVGPEKMPGYAAILAKPFENAYLPPGFYENLQRSYNPLFARQEVMGEYLNVFSGRVYHQFDRKLNVYPLPEDSKVAHQPVLFTRERPLLWALDFNINPAASIIAQTVPRIKGDRIGVSEIGNASVQLNVLDEIFLQDSTTYDVCEEFLERMERIRKGRKLHVYIYGDPAGAQRKSSAQKTDWQIIREFFGRHADKFTVSFRVRNAHPPIKDRVNAVNWACCSATGRRTMFVHEWCKETIRDLEEVGWKKNNSGVFRLELDQDKDPMRTHVSDALGYLVEMEFGLRAKSGERAGQIF